MVAIGEVWEGHELLNELDRGMVRTFLARQIGDMNALVWLHLREGARIERALFVAEIARLQRFSDKVPQIVRVLYGDVSGSIAWAASPFQPGTIRLKDAIRGPELGLAALKAVIEVGECLVRANEIDAVHGALSPDRVYIATGDGYSITHFGFVRLFQLGVEEALREPYHVAPELLFGGKVGRRTDVYGFGTVVYELLCQRVLYSDPKDPAVSAQTWKPDFPIAVPPRLRRVMAKALEKDPRRRYPTVRHMVETLRFLAGKWDDLAREPAEVTDVEDDVLRAPDTPPPRKSPSRTLPPRTVEEWEPFLHDEPTGSVDEETPVPPPPPLPMCVSLERLPLERPPPNDVPAIELPSLDPPPPLVSEVQPAGLPSSQRPCDPVPAPEVPPAQLTRPPLPSVSRRRRVIGRAASASLFVLGFTLSGFAFGAAGMSLWLARPTRAVMLMPGSIQGAVLRFLTPPPVPRRSAPPPGLSPAKRPIAPWIRSPTRHASLAWRSAESPQPMPLTYRGASGLAGEEDPSY
jgi:eukaryotic-like serine/threonine-protein kinase